MIQGMTQQDCKEWKKCLLKTISELQDRARTKRQLALFAFDEDYRDELFKQANDFDTKRRILLKDFHDVLLKEIGLIK